MKALYPIKLPKSSGDASEVARASEQVNEEHLNDNFRTITSELVKLWEGGERQLNIMSSRMTETETGLAATNTIINGIQADVATNTTAILQMPDAIMSSVSTTLEGYATVGYVDGETGELETATQNLTSQITQVANDVSVNFNSIATIGGEVSELSSWVRIIGQGAVTLPGVIIGASDNPTSLKAEAGELYFYKGDDTKAQWDNALAGFDAAGNFVANAVHTESTLLDGKFDIDVVTANSVDFLHITGRNT
jgi:hypothetical protein